MTSNERAVAIAGTVNSDNIFTKITTVKINGKEVSQDLYADMLGDQIKCQEKECPKTDCQEEIKTIKTLKTRLQDANTKNFDNSNIKRQLEQKNNEIKAKDKKIANKENEIEFLRSAPAVQRQAQQQAQEVKAKAAQEVEAKVAALKAAQEKVKAQQVEDGEKQKQAEEIQKAQTELAKAQTALTKATEQQDKLAGRAIINVISNKKSQEQAAAAKAKADAQTEEITSLKEEIFQEKEKIKYKDEEISELNKKIDQLVFSSQQSPTERKQQIKITERQKQLQKLKQMKDERRKRSHQTSQQAPSSDTHANPELLKNTRPPPQGKYANFFIKLQDGEIQLDAEDRGKEWIRNMSDEQRRFSSIAFYSEHIKKTAMLDVHLIGDTIEDQYGILLDKIRVNEEDTYKNYMKEYIKPLYSGKYKTPRDARHMKNGLGEIIKKYKTDYERKKNLPMQLKSDYNTLYKGADFKTLKEIYDYMDRNHNVIKKYYRDEHTLPPSMSPTISPSISPSISPNTSPTSSGTGYTDMEPSIHTQAALKARESIQDLQRMSGRPSAPPSSSALVPSRRSSERKGGGKFTIKNRHKTKHRAKQIKKGTRRRNKKLTRKV